MSPFGQGQDRRVLVAIDAEDLRLEVRAGLELQDLVARRFPVEDVVVAQPFVGRRVRPIGVLADHRALAVIVRHGRVLEEGPRLPPAVLQAVGRGLAVRHVSEEGLDLLRSLAGLLGLFDHRRPVVLGQNRHEGQPELPHAQSRRLRIAVRISRLEKDLQPMAVKRLRSLHERRMHQLRPIGAKVQLQNCVHREHEVLRRQVFPVAPRHALFQRNFGRPELRAIHRFFR